MRKVSKFFLSLLVIFRSFLTVVILVDTKRLLTVASIRVSLTSNDVEHVFMRLLTIRYLWRNVWSYAFLLLKLGFFYGWIFFYMFWTLDSYRTYELQILSPFFGLSFQSLDSIHWSTILKISSSPIHLFFSFIACSVGVIPKKKPLPNPRPQRFMLSSHSRVVLAPTYRPLFCSELIFLCGVE